MLRISKKRKISRRPGCLVTRRFFAYRTNLFGNRITTSDVLPGELAKAMNLNHHLVYISNFPLIRKRETLIFIKHVFSSAVSFASALSPNEFSLRCQFHVTGGAMHIRELLCALIPIVESACQRSLMNM